MNRLVRIYILIEFTSQLEHVCIKLLLTDSPGEQRYYR